MNCCLCGSARSNILILGAEEETGGAVTYMHKCVHIHAHVQYNDDTYLVYMCLLKGLDVLLLKKTHTHGHLMKCKNLEFAILPEGQLNMVNCL